jgi:membrane protein
MNKIKRLVQFLSIDLWRLTTYSSKGRKDILYLVMKTLVLSVRLCFQRQLKVQASALTYYTFFATIPILAFIFAIGRGFGMDEYISQFFVQFFSSNKESSAVQLLFSLIESYLNHAKGGVFVGIGLCFLFWSVFNVFTQIEKSLNEIWGVRRARPFIRRFSDYFSLTLLIPFLIIISSGFSLYVKYILAESLLSPPLQFFLTLKPWLLCCIICTLVYVAIPNTKVKFANALLAGVLAGSSVLLFKELYMVCMRWATNYNAVYGSLAAIPMLMLFLRIMWIIILCGAEISFAGQSFRMYEFRSEVEDISARYGFFVMLFILHSIVKRFDEGGKPYTLPEIVKEQNMPVRLASVMLTKLCQCNILIESKQFDHKREISIFQPAIETSKITIGYVAHQLQVTGTEDFLPDKTESQQKIWNFVKEKENSFRIENSSMLIKDL